MQRGGRRSHIRACLAGLALVLAGSLIAACDSHSSRGAASLTTPSSTAVPTQLPRETLTFGVVGSADEVDQYREMASLFAPLNRPVTVRIQSWPDDAAMMASFHQGTPVPDVLLASRRDLSWLTDRHRVQPVDGLLDDRGFDFGDQYPRSSLTALSVDSRLQCLPYGISPSVIYYNKGLVKLGQIRNDPPTPGQGWSLEQFAATARSAVRQHPGIAGTYVDSNLTGVAPYIYSGGGDLFDDDTAPTTLTFSDEGNQKSLIRTVRVLRAPGMSLTSGQLAQQSAFDWFRAGKLAMIEGSRALVPLLRTQLGFDFDVMPMPDLGTPATVGGLTGLCVSQHARDVATAADFLVYASSAPALGLVAAGGYLQPANQTVALSGAFQQPGRLPIHAEVFTFSVKSMVYPPLLQQWDQLDQAVDPLISELLQGEPADVPRTTRRIDRASYRVLGPKFGPTLSPSPSAGQAGG